MENQEEDIDLSITDDNQRKIARQMFTQEEDKHLIDLVKEYGERNWRVIAKKMDKRTTRQCRERYRNYLSPNLTNGPWTAEEDLLLEQKYIELGPKWAAIAQHFKNRSDVNIKNRWASNRHKAMRTAPKSFVENLIIPKKQIIAALQALLPMKSNVNNTLSGSNNNTNTNTNNSNLNNKNSTVINVANQAKLLFHLQQQKMLQQRILAGHSMNLGLCLNINKGKNSNFAMNSAGTNMNLNNKSNNSTKISANNNNFNGFDGMLYENNIGIENDTMNNNNEFCSVDNLLEINFVPPTSNFMSDLNDSPTPEGMIPSFNADGSRTNFSCLDDFEVQPLYPEFENLGLPI